MIYTIPQFEAQYNDKHIVHITSDLNIRVGCECYDYSYWHQNIERVGKANGYSETEIAVYRRFIYAAHLVIENHIKPLRDVQAIVGQHWRYKDYDNNTYVVAQIDNERVALIDIANGNRWTAPAEPGTKEMYQGFPFALIAGKDKVTNFELVKQSKYYKGDDE